MHWEPRPNFFIVEQVDGKSNRFFILVANPGIAFLVALFISIDLDFLLARVWVKSYDTTHLEKLAKFILRDISR